MKFFNLCEKKKSRSESDIFDLATCLPYLYATNNDNNSETNLNEVQMQHKTNISVMNSHKQLKTHSTYTL